MRKLLVMSAVAATLLAPAGAIAKTSQTQQQTKQVRVTAQVPRGPVCHPSKDYLNSTIQGWPTTSMMCGD